ncbi:MAG TPA: type I methionyl aminopeptidase [Acidobacteriota bacterium]|nr:type I methionyl aminopeptidase [Acidobacteriota bacterium]
MSITSLAELRGMEAAGHAAWAVLSHMLDHVRAGVSTAELDRIGASKMKELGARSAPQLAVGFPSSTCISVDDEIAHGVPGSRKLREDSLVNIDVSVELGGFYADTGASISLDEANPVHNTLCRAGREALNRALAEIKPGALLNRIGRAAEGVARKHGFQVIRDLSGHGTGRALWEEPREICCYYNPRDCRRMKAGMVMAVEPFVSTGARHVRLRDDGWTLATEDGGLAVQYEHTVVVSDHGPLVVTAPKPYLVRPRQSN